VDDRIKVELAQVLLVVRGSTARPKGK
jgi:hypothetical protein